MKVAELKRRIRKLNDMALRRKALYDELWLLENETQKERAELMAGLEEEVEENE